MRLRATLLVAQESLSLSLSSMRKFKELTGFSAGQKGKGNPVWWKEPEFYHPVYAPLVWYIHNSDQSETVYTCILFTWYTVFNELSVTIYDRYIITDTRRPDGVNAFSMLSSDVRRWEAEGRRANVVYNVICLYYNGWRRRRCCLCNLFTRSMMTHREILMERETISLFWCY